MLITGGLGFIGANFIRQELAAGTEVIDVDSLTYAGDPRRLADVDGRHRWEQLDVLGDAFGELLQQERPDVIVHFAAESHVTRSEDAAALFFRTNVEGTKRVIEAARAAAVGVVVHISTDEVYGPCYGEPFKE